MSRQSPNFSRQSIAAAQAPGLAIARLGDQIAAIGRDVTQEFVDLRRVTVFNEIRNRTMLGIDAAIAEEKANPDYATLEERLSPRLQQLAEDAVGGVGDVQTRTSLVNSLAPTVASSLLDARDYVRRKDIDAGRASFLAGLDISRERQARANPLEIASLQSHDAAMFDAVKSLGLYTSEELGRIRSAHEYNLSRDAVQADGFVDPAGTANRLLDPQDTTYSGIEAADRFTLARQFLNDARQRENALDKAHQDAKDDALLDAVIKANSGELTIDQLNSAARQWGFSRQDYTSLHEVIVNGPPQKQSVPGVLQDSMIAVYSTPPRITQGELTQQLQGGQINLEDFQKLSNALRIHKQQAQETGDASLGRRQTQAQTLLRSALGFASDFDIGDEDQKTMLALGMDELTRRSSYFGGIEDPLVAVDGIIKKILPQRAGMVATRINALRKTAKYKTFEALGTRAQARARGMSDADYVQAVRDLEELEQLENLQKGSNGGR